MPHPVSVTPGSISIAGAGPSGLTAAITLARAGWRVTVFEARATVGARFIGDHQMMESYSNRDDVRMMLAGFGLEENYWIRPATAGVLFGPNLDRYEVASDIPYGYFLKRGPEGATLDRGLLEQAEALGVTVRFRERVAAEDVHVMATGPQAPDGLAKETTFHTDLPDGTVWVIFDMRLAPGGYTYLFAFDGFATMGTAVTRGFKRIDEYFERSLARFRQITAFKMEGVRRAYSYMNFSLKPSAAPGGCPHVGEAGGFQDYLFGLGIRYALTTGYLAARSLIDGVDYDEAWKRELRRRQEASVVNRFLYELGGNFGLKAFLAGAARQRDFRAYLHGWAQASPLKRLALPFLKTLWRPAEAGVRESRCQHLLPSHWCRNRHHIEATPELGPIPGESA